jgi:catechol 2,3-dioxygenase-like lactoylglutathione lyase family enzyme
MTLFLGARTIIYPTADLAASKRWFTDLLGYGPYFDQPFYVGFNVGGYELGIDPNADPTLGAQSYWGVADIQQAWDQLIAAGAQPNTEITETGDDIKVASVLEVAGSFLGLIENPHFQPSAVPNDLTGPGR